MLEKLQLQDFDKVYAIMEEAFPDDEHRFYDEQKALLDNPKYTIYGLRNDQNGEIKAFITVYQFDDFAFVEHFATNVLYRNQGLGAVILRELQDMLQCRICLEVELPDTDMAVRRIGFYRRNGFSLNNYDYIQPPMSKGKNSMPLLIMTTDGTITKGEFDTIKSTLYREVYKVK